MGKFSGQSYLVDPRGDFVVMASRDIDEVMVGEMNKKLNRGNWIPGHFTGTVAGKHMVI